MKVGSGDHGISLADAWAVAHRINETSSASGRPPRRAPGEEPVLVWAAEEDLLLANDPALAMLADAAEDSASADAEPAALAPTLARLVARDRRFRPARGQRSDAAAAPGGRVEAGRLGAFQRTAARLAEAIRRVARGRR
jgi:hypothetical protein